MRKQLISIIGLAFAVCSCTQSEQAAQAPLKMIIETDMGNDIDDALALALALRAVDNGEAELLAVGCHKNCPTAAAYTDAVCTFYDHPEIPVAMSITPVQEFSNYTDYSATEKDFVKSRTEYPEPVALYRKILASQPDGSVTFVSLGFGTTLAQLLESTPDEYSPLAGVDLVARKTRGLSIMAGSYGEKKRSEYNVRNDIPAMQTVFAKWPTPIWQNPFEIGKQTMYPGALIEQNLGYYEPNPVVAGYEAYQQMPYDRPSWDILSVLYPLRPELFTHSEKGIVTVDDEGYTWFTPDPEGKHIVLSATLDQPQALMKAEQDYTLRYGQWAEQKKLLCFDLDATLTDHRCPLESAARQLLDTLKQKYDLVMVCAGNCPRVYKQMGEYPINILGNYGMQESTVENGELKIVREDVFPADTAFFLKQNGYLREKYGYTKIYGDPVEFHKSGMVTLALLGTEAPLDLKHKFDPDRAKRRVMYPEVCEIFKDYSVYIGGSSSFDFSAKQYNKYAASMRYATEHGYTEDQVLFVGDDFGDGGGDSHVRINGMDYIWIKDYTKTPEILSFLY
ncbi:MAG: nucleoside hydrolase [Bacteroidales bacterium]|nr:nucleoside hydrolase [Bacteroidales bacterium]